MKTYIKILATAVLTAFITLNQYEATEGSEQPHLKTLVSLNRYSKPNPIINMASNRSLTPLLRIGNAISKLQAYNYHHQNNNVTEPTHKSASVIKLSSNENGAPSEVWLSNTCETNECRQLLASGQITSMDSENNDCRNGLLAVDQIVAESRRGVKQTGQVGILKQETGILQNQLSLDNSPKANRMPDKRVSQEDWHGLDGFEELQGSEAKSPPIYKSQPKQIGGFSDIRGASQFERWKKSFVAKIDDGNRKIKLRNSQSAAGYHPSKKKKEKKKMKIKSYRNNNRLHYAKHKEEKTNKFVHNNPKLMFYSASPQADYGKYFEYRSVPKKGVWKYGFKRGNAKHMVERMEHGNKSHFKSEVKWKDKEGKGHHVFDYNHADQRKPHHDHYHAASSTPTDAVQQKAANKKMTIL